MNWSGNGSFLCCINIGRNICEFYGSLLCRCSSGPFYFVFSHSFYLKFSIFSAMPIKDGLENWIFISFTFRRLKRFLKVKITPPSQIQFSLDILWSPSFFVLSILSSCSIFLSFKLVSQFPCFLSLQIKSPSLKNPRKRYQKNTKRCKLISFSINFLSHCFFM